MEGNVPPLGDAVPTLADDPALGLSQRAKLEILGAVMLGLFLGALDQTVVGTALPRRPNPASAKGVEYRP